MKQTPVHRSKSRGRVWFFMGGATLLAAILLFAWNIAWVVSASPERKVAQGKGSGGEAITNSPPGRLKVFVASEGMVAVTSKELKAIEPSWGSVDPREVRLFFRGAEQLLWTETNDDGFALRFYGKASTSLYTDENIYILERGNQDGKRMAEGNSVKLESDAGNPNSTYTKTIIAEENLQYVPTAREGDHWLWESIPAPGQAEFTIQLADLAPGNGELRIAIWASTESHVNPDHHIRVSMNGQVIGDQEWDGKGWYLWQSEVAGEVLTNGDNTISIEAVGDTGAPADIVYVNRFEVDYPRQLVAEGDILDFFSPGQPQYINGFSGDINIFDITDPENVIFSGSAPKQEKAGFRFLGEPDHRYLALGPQGYRNATKIAQFTSFSDLRKQTPGATYIALGPRELLEALAPLLRFREENGLQGLAIPVEAVYDQFNHGFPEPEAIQAFLKYAWQAWEPAPEYVFLVGDATFDPRGYISSKEANRLPTFFIDTEFGGETASDLPFAQLDGDEIPDIIISRIPASNQEQVRIITDKIVDYESKNGSADWQRRILAIADGQDPSFRRDAEGFLGGFPADYPSQLFSPQAGVVDANEQIRELLDKEMLIVGYFGHGSVNMWGKDRLFTSQDVERLKNGGHLPVLLNMTCLTGLFTHPKTMSLTETFLWQPQGGAVAVLAPTSLTLPSDQSFFSDAFVKAFVDDPSATLGQIFLKAQRQVSPTGAGSRDVLYTFLLFGDPALRLIYNPSP